MMESIEDWLSDYIMFPQTKDISELLLYQNMGYRLYFWHKRYNRIISVRLIKNPDEYILPGDLISINDFEIVSSLSDLKRMPKHLNIKTIVPYFLIC